MLFFSFVNDLNWDLFFLQLGLFVISLISNFLSALAGGGAGLIQLPALILFGLPFPAALATHKVASVALGLGATSRYLREGSLKAKFTLLVLLFGLPGVYLGTRVVILLPDKLFSFLLGSLTLGLGIFSFFRKDFGSKNRLSKINPRRLIFGGLGLFLLGFLNGSLTSGTGLFVTIWLVSWFGLSYPIAVAYTLILVGIFWNGAGALFLGLQGNIEWYWVPSLLTGSVMGGYFGAHYGIKYGSKLIKTSFEILSVFLSISLLIRSF